MWGFADLGIKRACSHFCTISVENWDMKQSPFLHCSPGESSYPSLDLKNTILSCLQWWVPCHSSSPVMVSLKLPHLSSSAIWLAVAPSRDKQLCVTHSHTPSKVLFRTHSHAAWLSPQGVPLQWDVYLFSHCVNEAKFSLPWCVGSLERDCKSRSEHFLVKDRVVKLHCCL